MRWWLMADTMVDAGSTNFEYTVIYARAVQPSPVQPVLRSCFSSRSYVRSGPMMGGSATPIAAS